MASFHKAKLPTPAPAVITLDNVGELTTYDLRQELNRREAMDIPEEKINHKSLLKRLIVELVKDKEKDVNEKEEQRVAALNVERAEAMKIREAKKQEAIERSKARQAAKGTNYFSEKASLNEAMRLEKEKKIQLAKETSMEGDGSVSSVQVVGGDEEEDEEEEAADSNPFKTKRKFKIAVK